MVSERSALPSSLLLELFGIALFARLARGYPAFLVGIDSTEELVARYETHVAAQIRLLHPDARPPDLTLVRRAEHAAEVVYRSSAGLGDLAFGLLRGSVAWFDEPVEVRRVPGRTPEWMTFRLQRRVGARAAGATAGRDE